MQEDPIVQIELPGLEQPPSTRKAFTKGTPLNFLLSDSAPLESRGVTPLHHLCLFYPEKTELAHQLLLNGADPNAQDKDLQTPLHYLVLSSKNGVALAKILIEAGAKSFSLDRHQKAPLSYILDKPFHPLFSLLQECEKSFSTLIERALESSESHHLEKLAQHMPQELEEFFFQNLSLLEPPTLQRILKTGVDLTNILFFAIKDQRFDLLQPLTELGLDPLKENSQGIHPFLFSCQSGSQEWIGHYLSLDKSLLKKKAPDGRTALHFAVLGGKLSTAQFFIEQGLDSTEKDNHGRTLLHYACQSGEFEVVNTFLSKEADLYLFDDHGLSPIDHACRKGRARLIKDLFTWQLYPYSDARKALLNACQEGEVETVRTLLACRVEVEADGPQPIHVASLARQSQVIEILLERGFDPDTPDHLSRTALHHACRAGDLAIVEQLLGHDAKTEVRNRYHQTPLDIAREYREIEIILLLIKHRADFTPSLLLDMICQEGAVDLLRYLLDQCLLQRKKVDLSNYLHSAYTNNQFEVLELLLKHIDELNYSSQKILNDLLHQASQQKHHKLVELLRQHGAQS